jgi:diaminopimelate decarboxylase
VVDGGLNHHLSASGNFGQVIRKNYPAAVGTRMNAEQTEVASVVGPCAPARHSGRQDALAHGLPK